MDCDYLNHSNVLGLLQQSAEACACQLNLKSLDELFLKPEVEKESLCSNTHAVIVQLHIPGYELPYKTMIFLAWFHRRPERKKRYPVISASLKGFRKHLQHQVRVLPDVETRMLLALAAI